MSALLEVEGIRKKYGQFEVLKGVSLQLERGQAKVVMGPSGTGKSTLLRCINYLTPPDAGTVRLDGEEVVPRNLNRIRQQVAFVFQDFNLFTHLRVIDNITIGPRRILGLSKTEARDRAMRELERVGLADKVRAYPAELSGGQQQRVSIARALAMEPKVILFDEPTSALDPELTGEVVNVMKRLASEGMTMLVVSHEIGFARSAADEIVFMDGGHILEQGPPAQLFDAPQHERTRRFLRMIGDQVGDAAAAGEGA
ncbi:amino acid ABC transporter ATP-binding protein [Ferruginivarius sediminum]|uniref:Amino acid ABC transporter ATP-binding protein n=1 Tax=Ferruginivarius sediminum TaxID=2661937 RepID=A0A369TGV0_9PROT|nr:amino acid ABC transporter ATP-binding protein [Ferruginivarius sediminum]RDD63844.1 amino acid ABC transporter ATP-binding protein [Ferruginivarius sediminum]